MSITNLADHKAAYFHDYGKIALPSWLGKATRIKDTSDDGLGQLDTEYLTFDKPGDSMLSNLVWKSPGNSGLSLLAKEQLLSRLLEWSEVWDLDVRVQCTDKPVDDPLNWKMIKRFCHCWPSQVRSDDETSITAGDGETVLNIPVVAAYRPVIINPVSAIGPSAVGQSFVTQLPSICNVRGMGKSKYAYNPDGVNNSIRAVEIDAVEHVIVMPVANDQPAYSHDAGLTYTQADQPAVASAIKFVNYSTILLANGTALYISSDGGKTYTAVTTAGLIQQSIVKIANDFVGNCYLLDTAGQLYKYTDGQGLIVLGNSGVTTAHDLLVVDGLIFVGGFTSVPVIMMSEDGLSWVESYHAVGAGNAYGDVNPKLVLASVGSGVVYAALSSVVDQGTSGTYSFTEYAIGPGDRVRVTYGNNLYITTPTNNGRSTFTSSDGIIWVEHVNALPVAAAWTGLTYGAGLFVAVGKTAINVSVCATSPDGVIWTSRTVTGGLGLYGVCYADGQFVAVGSAVAFTSPNGILWTARAFALLGISVTWKDGLYVACGLGTTFATSPDGILWSTVNTGAGAVLFYSITANDDIFVATSLNLIIYSTDGSAWFQVPVTGSVNDVVWNGAAFFGVSDLAKVFISVDGIIWTEQALVNTSWSSVTHNGAYIVGVSDTHSVVSSGSDTHYMALFRTYVLRSVNWGAIGTWQVEYYDEHLLSESVEIFVPTDLACSHVNHAKAIGIAYQIGVADPVTDWDAPDPTEYQFLTLGD